LFKKTPYKLRIERQPISKGQLGESVREIKPPIVVSAGEKQVSYKIFGDYITPIKDTKGIAREVQEGSKAIIFKPTPTRIRIGLKEFKILPKGEKVIFRGLSPFTKAGKKERAKIIKKLKKLGIGEEEAKSLIALRYPKVIEIKSDITGRVYGRKKGMDLILRSEEKIFQPKYVFSDKFGTIISRGRRPIERVKEVELKPSQLTAKKGEPIFIGTEVTYTPSKALGKQTETYDLISAVRKKGKNF